MVLDIIIAVILLCGAIYGFKKGFVFTLIHTVGWLAAIVFAYILTPRCTVLLKEKTGIYDAMTQSVQGKMDVSLKNLETIHDGVPEGIRSILSTPTGTDSVLESATLQIVNLFTTILVFIVLFILAKIILWLLLRLLSKDYKDGFAHFMDGFLGLLFGLLRSAILIFLLLALLVPMATLISTDLTVAIQSQLDSSYVANYLYNENYLLLLLKGYIAG